MIYLKGSNGESFEEHCIFNPERIDHIEIVTGPAEVKGLGPQYWPPDDEEECETDDDAGAAWFWYDDSAAGAQTVAMRYRAAAERRLEAAWAAGERVVRVSETHEVHLQRMIQRRVDDGSRQRKVERRVPIDLADPKP